MQSPQHTQWPCPRFAKKKRSCPCLNPSPTNCLCSISNEENLPKCPLLVTPIHPNQRSQSPLSQYTQPIIIVIQMEHKFLDFTSDRHTDWSGIWKTAHDLVLKQARPLKPVKEAKFPFTSLQSVWSKFSIFRKRTVFPLKAYSNCKPICKQVKAIWLW